MKKMTQRQEARRDWFNAFFAKMKRTQEQQDRADRIESAISKVWYGLLTAAFVLASIVYGPWLP